MHDSIYLSAGVAEFCWALRVGDTAIDHPPLPWPAWGVVVTAAFAGWICCIGRCFATMPPAGTATPACSGCASTLLALFGSSILASSLSYTLHQPLFLTAWLGCANLFFIVYAAVYLVAALRAPTTARLLVALAGALNVDRRRARLDRDPHQRRLFPIHLDPLFVGAVRPGARLYRHHRASGRPPPRPAT